MNKVVAMRAGLLVANGYLGQECSSRRMLWDGMTALFMHSLIDEKRNGPSQALQNLTYLIENFTRFILNRVRFLLLEDTSDCNRLGRRQRTSEKGEIRW
jgi:hypothetical protein